MKLPILLYRYIGQQFLINFCALLMILLSIVYLFDFIELLRRSSSHPDVSISIITKMTLLKLPEVGQMLFPFAVLFSSIFTFWRLARTQELVVIRSTGLSAWQFLLPILLSSILLGILAIVLVNPISSALLSKYEVMETEYLHKKSNLVTISKTGLWLRQDQEQGYSIIHAKSFTPHKWTLNNVIIFYMDENGRMLKRIDAHSAQLIKNAWLLHDVLLHTKEPFPEKFDEHKIFTELTGEEIEDSFASPETLPFWRIPEFIRTMEDTGFSSVRLRVHFQSLLSRPFIFAAMVLLAAAVSLRPPRQGGITFLVVIGVGIGFFIFFMESILHAFGISQQIPVALAAWTPASVSLLLGSAAILHLEDG